MTKTGRALDGAEIRVLGSLLEKEQTTPEIYPLTVNALIQACNQKTAREPVMEMSEGAVHGALRQLFNEGLVTRTEGARVTRWRHNLDLQWDLDPARKAVVTLLLLRGAQTPGELRNRSERMHAFSGVADLDAALTILSASPEPLIRELPKAPGQKESRWVHLLGTSASAAEAPMPAVQRYAVDEGEEISARVADLNRRVRELERVVNLFIGSRTAESVAAAIGAHAAGGATVFPNQESEI